MTISKQASLAVWMARPFASAAAHSASLHHNMLELASYVAEYTGQI